MTTTLTVTGPTFTNRIQPAFPTISNLKTLAFFGNAVDDNNSGNRVVGGPAITVQAGAPVYASNYVNLGLQAGGTRNDTLDTNNPRNSASLAAGFTWAAACRVSQLSSALAGLMFGDTNGGTTAPQSFFAHMRIDRLTIASGNAARSPPLMCAKSCVTNWHFVVFTYTGGGTGTFTLYDFTEDANTGIPVTWATTGVTFTTGVQSPHFGCSGVAEGQGNNPIEHAFGMIAQSVISVPTMVQLYGWAKANLARRGIVV